MFKITALVCAALFAGMNAQSTTTTTQASGVGSYNST